MLMLALTVGVFTVSAQTKQQKKMIAKSAKEQAKTLAKEGWVLLESGTMESVFYNLQVKTTVNGAQEIVGTAVGMRSPNLGKTTARNNALNEYAELAKTMVRGRLTSDLSDVAGEQMENLIAGYERLVLKEINGEVKPVCTLYRKNKDGKYDVRGYFVVDQDAASSARRRAMELAMEEAQLAQKYGNQISNFINEGFDNLKE